LAFTTALAQQSPGYVQKEHVLNGGGRPLGGSTASSASFRITLDALGEAVTGSVPSSASFRVQSGFVEGYRPPTEVLGLFFSGKTTLKWQAEASAGEYELYRGPVASLPGTFGACIQSGVSGVSVSEPSVPSGGSSYFYLVTVRNRLREEGTKGHRSSGAERPNPAPCP
jgi:hypothetical protein